MNWPAPSSRSLMMYVHIEDSTRWSNRMRTVDGEGGKEDEMKHSLMTEAYVVIRLSCYQLRQIDQKERKNQQ